MYFLDEFIYCSFLFGTSQKHKVTSISLEKAIHTNFVRSSDILMYWPHPMKCLHLQALLEVAANELECEFTVVGCTGLEDRLQVGVPRTIENIKSAGVKLWVLTGDKMATAVNIGYACRLLSRDMELVVLEDVLGTSQKGSSTATSKLQLAHDHAYGLRGLKRKRPDCPLGLVVDGESLLQITASSQGKELLLRFTCKCSIVLACRVSPAQKREIVMLVKFGLPHKPMTLAIGDGANDVPMIQVVDRVADN